MKPRFLKNEEEGEDEGSKVTELAAEAEPHVTNHITLKFYITEVTARDSSQDSESSRFAVSD